MLTVDECKGYACPPEEQVNLPECEYGWKIGNNTAVCATQQPAPLATTGSDPAMALGMLGIAIAMALVGIGLIAANVQKKKYERDSA
jgi:hypothetical protein